MTVNNVNIGQREPIRIVLSAEQSEQLRAIPHDAPVFFACGRASWPDGESIALHLVECSHLNCLNNAVKVATGESVARKKSGNQKPVTPH